MVFRISKIHTNADFTFSNNMTQTKKNLRLTKLIKHVILSKIAIGVDIKMKKVKNIITYIHTYIHACINM